MKRILKVDDWPTFNKFEEFVIEHQLLRHKVASLLVTKYKYGYHKVVPAWMLFGGAFCDPKSPLYNYSFQPLTKRLPLQEWLEKGDVMRAGAEKADAKTKEKQLAKFNVPFDSLVPLAISQSKFDLLAPHDSHNNAQRRIAWLWIDTKFSELVLNSTISEDKEWKDLLAKLEGLKEKVPDREHILMIVSNRNISKALIEKIGNKSVLLVSRTGDSLQWLLSPACARTSKTTKTSKRPQTTQLAVIKLVKE